MNNMTSLIQNHTEYLESASSKVSNIHSILEKTAVFAKSWNHNVERGGPLGNYVLRIVTPLATLILGNYGLPPSFTRNAMLILGGIPSLKCISKELSNYLIGIGFGEMLVHVRHLGWTWPTAWNQMHSVATTFTHLPRKHNMRSQTLAVLEAIPSE
jgi:hypothetical protein